eukprot:scaffold2890_cov31-Phaeocystis_antarctica.AAC.2
MANQACTIKCDSDLVQVALEVRLTSRWRPCPSAPPTWRVSRTGTPWPGTRRTSGAGRAACPTSRAAPPGRFMADEAPRHPPVVDLRPPPRC